MLQRTQSLEEALFCELAYFLGKDYLFIHILKTVKISPRYAILRVYVSSTREFALVLSCASM